MHVELLSRKYYSVVSEITVHTWNMVVLGRTASLYKKMHIHQEPVNLTWFGKRVPAAALKWSGGHKASARAHTEWSVTPQGKSGQTRREKAASASQGEASAESGPADSWKSFEKGLFCCLRHLLFILLEQPWGLNTLCKEERLLSTWPSDDGESRSLSF